jgi:hypothetical protein
MDGRTIRDIDITGYERPLIGLYIDDNDIAHMGGLKEKDEFGLTSRFQSFMENMIGGPYLTRYKDVVRLPRDETAEHVLDNLLHS